MKQICRLLSASPLLLFASLGWPQGLPVIDEVEPQPLVSQALRLQQALAFLGSPLRAEDSARLTALADAPHDERLTRAIQELLDPYCLAMVEINPEMRVKTLPGPAPKRLIQQGWRSFLVKVHNESGTRAALEAASPNAEPLLYKSERGPEPAPKNALSEGAVAQRFLELSMYRRRPMLPTLSGLNLEYQIVQLFTTVQGVREASISFNVGRGTEDIGYRNAIPVLFKCDASVKVVLRVKDIDGSPTMGSFLIRDNVERLADASGATDYRIDRARRRPWERGALRSESLRGIYPLPSRRLAATDEFADFYFQPQVYRADGEHVMLPAGEYEVTFGRGPEYLTQTRVITVPEGVAEHEEVFQLERWIHMASLGWYSADHHIHAGGCSHYESPEAGVLPEHMWRQVLGEDLNIGCVLTWGPCWYFQKTFFEASVSSFSTRDNLMRYDVEVSGFPSSHAGHVCLLRLKEDDYPGTTRIEEWPSWTLPVLKWAKAQGGVVGYAHSGWGLEPQTPTEQLPNYVIPKFDGIGANEYIVTVTQDAVDFISMVDTVAPWELNIWYHTLNCGFRTRISGETDFPCIYDERVGMGRSYAKLDGPLDFDEFTEQIKRGANYVSDGMSHIFDFKVDGAEMGVDGSELLLDAPKTVRVTAKVAAYLSPERSSAETIIGESPWALKSSKPHWHLERARLEGSRNVPVELIVNGHPVARQVFLADGEIRDVSFDVDVDVSSWIAIRILPSSHTNPIFALVGGKPVRASRRSAEWCMKSVDRCWKMKRPRIRPEELEDAKLAYDEARGIYKAILDESVAD